MREPLASSLRPTRLDQVVGHDRALSPGSVLARAAEGSSRANIILWGPPGVGKTTIARIIAGTEQMVELSGASSTVKDIRDAARLEGPVTLFVDEIHRFSKTQADALLPLCEDGTVRLIGATTENPSVSLPAALLSRCTVVALDRLDDEQVADVVSRSGVEFSDDALDLILAAAAGDARSALNIVQAAAHDPSPNGVRAAIDTVWSRYDRAGHYDTISAFIKSIRASDPDAALVWLAKMIDSGEDPRFIARRLIISASEDVGLADSSVLPLAVAAAQAVERVGLPEGRIALAQATIAAALAPKSNSAYRAIDEALAAVRASQPKVPAHLRDASNASSRSAGAGLGYEYPHDAPGAVTAADNMPVGWQGRSFYRPASFGQEKALSAVLDNIKRLRSDRGQPPTA